MSSHVRRILLLITDLEIGGTPTVVRELAIRVREPSRVEIEVACLSRWGPVADQLRDAGVHVTAFEARGGRDLFATVRRLAQLVHERQQDTVFSFLIHANTVAALASRYLPHVRFLQSIQTTQSRPRWHWWVQKRIQKFAERIVVPSNAVANVASQRCGVEPARIEVIPNAIEPSEYPRVNVFASPQTRVGFLGRLDPVKNVPSLIEAMRRIDDASAQCLIFGDGRERARLAEVIAALRLGDRVHLRGPVNQPQDALRQMDVLVLPSTGEGFGLVLIEAMASGVPVIAANRGGITDVVEHEKNGLLIDRDFAGEIALALRQLIDDSALRLRLIENGLRTVREKFAWEVVLPRYRELLRIK
jgi:glycosyltransferase involved in cell wall biosynthesis